MALYLPIGLMRQMRITAFTQSGPTRLAEEWFGRCGTLPSLLAHKCTGGFLQRAAVSGRCLPTASSEEENQAQARTPAHGSEPVEHSEGCPHLCTACQGPGAPIGGLWHTGQSACSTHPPAVHAGGTLLIHSAMNILRVHTNNTGSHCTLSYS